MKYKYHSFKSERISIPILKNIHKEKKYIGHKEYFWQKGNNLSRVFNSKKLKYRNIVIYSVSSLVFWC